MKRLFSLILALCMLLCGVAEAETWTCSSCGTLNDHNFCGECGAKKSDEWVCSGCGGTNKSKFCPECGMARANNQAKATEAPVATATPAPAEAQVKVTPRVEFYRLNEKDKVHATYDTVIYTKDYDEEIQYFLGCRIDNLTDAPYVAKLTAEIAGETYSFADREIAANDDHSFIVTAVKLDPGEHHVKWFLEGVQAAEATVTVKDGNSDTYKWVQEHITVSSGLCLWDTVDKRRVESGLSIAMLSKLAENQKYIPHLTVTNNSSEYTPSLHVAFFLDNDTWWWDNQVLESGETLNYVHSSYEHKVGASELIVYVNGIRMDRTVFAIID